MSPDRQDLTAASQTVKYPPVASTLHTMRKLKSMNVNLLSIARYRTAPKRESPNNLPRAPRKMIGFCTPHVGPLSAMQNVNRAGATTSMVTKRRPVVQNSKIPERQTISLRESPMTSAKPAFPPYPRAAQNPGGEFCAARHFPQKHRKTGRSR